MVKKANDLSINMNKAIKESLLGAPVRKEKNSSGLSKTEKKTRGDKIFENLVKVNFSYM